MAVAGLAVSAHVACLASLCWPLSVRILAIHVLSIATTLGGGVGLLACVFDWFEWHAKIAVTWGVGFEMCGIAVATTLGSRNLAYYVSDCSCGSRGLPTLAATCGVGGSVLMFLPYLLYACVDVEVRFWRYVLYFLQEGCGMISCMLAVMAFVLLFLINAVAARELVKGREKGSGP
jgi:hypothetical protein